MKQSIFLPLTAFVLVAGLFVTGCQTKGPKNVTPIHGFPTQVANDNRNKPAITPDLTSTGPVTPPERNIPPGSTNPNPQPGVITDPLRPPQGLPDTTPKGPTEIPKLAEIINGREADRVTFAANAVHFDYDKAIVKQSEAGKLQPVISALKSSPQMNLQVEGHCDERGTEEYNRALGERRALAIRDFIVKNGKIAPGRITTTSFGEDKPAALGHDEAAWAKNRRGEIVLLRPQK
jgi:peptidoglycan-associated lipoprotein